MELSKEEKSGLWSTAVMLYSLAGPLVIAVLVMYGIFWDKMIKGEVCKFYSLTTQTTYPHFNSDGTDYSSS